MHQFLTIRFYDMKRLKIDQKFDIHAPPQWKRFNRQGCSWEGFYVEIEVEIASQPTSQ